MNFDNMNYYSWDVEELEDGIALVKAEILRLGGIPQAEELEVTQDEDVVSDDEEKQREVLTQGIAKVQAELAELLADAADDDFKPKGTKKAKTTKTKSRVRKSGGGPAKKGRKPGRKSKIVKLPISVKEIDGDK